jgi:hypothetical protein
MCCIDRLNPQPEADIDQPLPAIQSAQSNTFARQSMTCARICRFLRVPIVSICWLLELRDAIEHSLQSLCG